MDVGVAGMFGGSPRRDLRFLRDFAQTMEGLGYSTLWVPEHVVFFPSYESKYPYSADGAPNWGPETGLFDPLFVCQAAAMHTEHLRFATGVMILPQRPALLTAKEVMTLDHLTGGRFALGVGVGWSWEEYGALGVPFERRGKRMDEYVEAMKLAWTEDRATYKGEFVEFTDVVLNPKPITPGGPPVIVGGDSRAAMRRAARLGDGWYGWWASGELEPHLDELHGILAEHGRSASDDDFSLRLGMPIGREPLEEVAAKVERARAAGVDEFVLGAPIGTSTFESQLTDYAEACGVRG